LARVRHGTSAIRCLMARDAQDNGYDVNWDQVHNVRIRAAASRDRHKEIRFAKTKDDPLSGI